LAAFSSRRNVDLGRRRFERPIAARAQAFGGRVADPRARLDDAHCSEDRAIAGDISKLKELTERTVVEFARPRAKWLQTAELRCKCEDSLVEKKIERLDSGAIPNQQKTLLEAIPDRESEHSDKTFDRCDSPERIRFQQDLRVARAPELNAVRRELGPNLPEVIDFTVEYGRVATVRRDHRLVSGGTQVDDRQPAMAEAERRRIAHVFPRAVVIRPPMREVLQPKIERPGKLAQSGAWTIVADYSAHLALLPESHCGRFGRMQRLVDSIRRVGERDVGPTPRPPVEFVPGLRGLAESRAGFIALPRSGQYSSGGKPPTLAP